MREFKAEPGEVSGGEMETFKKARKDGNGKRKGRLKAGVQCIAKPSPTPHSPKWKEKKTPNRTAHKGQSDRCQQKQQ